MTLIVAVYNEDNNNHNNSETIVTNLKLFPKFQLKYCCWKRKKLKPNIPVLIHHDDGHIEVERVDLVQPLQKENVRHEQPAEVSEQFLPAIEDEGRDLADIDDDSTSLRCTVKKLRKSKKIGKI